MQIFYPCQDVFQPEMTFLFESGFKIKSFSVIRNYDFEIVLVKGSYQNTDAFCSGVLYGVCKYFLYDSVYIQIFIFRKILERSFFPYLILNTQNDFKTALFFQMVAQRNQCLK